MSTNLTTVPTFDVQALIRLATQAVPSPKSKRSYALYLDKILCGATSLHEFNRVRVLAFVDCQREKGSSAATRNIAIHAAKKLAMELKFAGLIGRDQCEGIMEIKAAPKSPVRTGRWLTIDQVDRLLDAPDKTTRMGVRDRAILALLIGCGLRREELINIQFKCIQERDGRAVLTDFKAKGDKIRVVALPSGVKRLLDEWLDTLQRILGTLNPDAYIFLPFNGRNGWIQRETRLSDSAIMFIIQRYSNQIGVVFSPHDLRRTYARLVRQSGADMEQIQFSLGHADLSTTQRYIGMNQNIKNAPGDLLQTTWGETIATTPPTR